ncbi:MAG: hypothetical protein Q9227_008232 [Pyrenula ochraceoflavens]
MDISPGGLAATIIPHIPFIVFTAILAIFRLSRNASVQEFLTELTVVAARPVLGKPAPLLQSQRQFNREFGIWGPRWIAKYTIPKPTEPNGTDAENVTAAGKGKVYKIQEALGAAIAALGDGNDEYTMPDIQDVYVEWTGYRPGVSTWAQRPNLPEQEQYKKLMGEIDADSPTILFFHGGAFCLMDPSTHRFIVSELAHKARGRCLSVRQRLAPQGPFPAALLDALISYLALLSPPPGAYHDAVPASQIVLAGDSSGGGLAASLLLLLLTLRRLGIDSLHFHGKAVHIPSPPVAGVAVTSPWLDISRCLPSVHANAKFDIIAPPSPDPSVPITIPTPDFPPDFIWPTTPPRVETYCNATMTKHPLVSPLAARRHHWEGSPPIYLNTGWEGIQDEAEVFARRVYSAGSTVIFEGYVGMPHCFVIILPFNRRRNIAYENWGAFSRQAVQTAGVERRNHGTWLDKNGTLWEVGLDQLGMQGQGRGYEARHGRKEDLDDIKVERLLNEQREWRVRLEQDIRQKWKQGRPHPRRWWTLIEANQ